ncbi:NAD-dependent epimerase/dehydratase family protein [Streptomyces sp. NPDC029674]|uniref:NAD-dependent epimerase/dehydratase family protein n=1 Tax=Streptomyces sp. NPDC029674 TaxID=3365297 RepID=UPI00384F0138
MTPTMFSMAPQPPPPWRRAMVTAGAGFLGSHLCERLLDAGVAVDCVDDMSAGSPGNVEHLTDRPGFRVLELDLARPGRADTLTGPYDLVVHFACPAPAAAQGPLETLDAGSVGAGNALAVAERDGARFLLASTCPVHGDPSGTAEETQRFSEALTTAYVSAKEADAGIVRVFPAYGPRMGSEDGRLIPDLIRQALSGGPVTVPGDGGDTPSLCYVDDTVDGVLLVAASRSVRPVDIGGDPGPTLEEIGRRVLDLTGSDAPLKFTGRTRDEDPEPPGPATGFAHELFGWTPKVSLDDGLKRTIAHFQSDGRGAPRAEGGARHACSW